MKILIIEDEMRIARRLARMSMQYFAKEDVQVAICEDLETGLIHLNKHPVDLLLLDLNLNGADGFEVLQKMVARSFHTIIVSANSDRAITAFAYGVLDFVPKPFDEDRLYQAFNRLQVNAPAEQPGLKHLSIRINGVLKLVDIETVSCIKAAGIYAALNLMNGAVMLHNKSLDALERILPVKNFMRIHRSTIVRVADIADLIIEPGGRYAVRLKNDQILPVGRSRYKMVRDCLGEN